MGNAVNKITAEAISAATDVAGYAAEMVQQKGSELKIEPNTNSTTSSGTTSLPTEAAALEPSELFERGVACAGQGQEILARLYFETACNKGHGKACVAAGDMWKEGVGSPPNQQLAQVAYDHGCKKGEGEGCFRLAEFLVAANTDLSKAAELVEKACGMKTAPSEVPSCAVLGAFWMSGHGKPQNMEMAARIFKRGCALREASSCIHLGQFYLQGIGLQRSPASAVTVLKVATELGSPDAAELLREATVAAKTDDPKPFAECVRG